MVFPQFPPASPRGNITEQADKVNTLERPKQVRTWTRQSGTAPGSQAATAPPELHDDLLVGEDFSCLKYSGNSGNPIIRAETLEILPRKVTGFDPMGPRHKRIGSTITIESSLPKSRRDTTAYGTIPYIDLRDENLDGGGLSSMDRMCVKTDRLTCFRTRWVRYISSATSTSRVLVRLLELAS